MISFQDKFTNDRAEITVDIIDENGLLLMPDAIAVVDTGASMSVIRPSVADQCGLQSYPSEHHPDEDKWCDFSFRHPELGDFQVTALYKNLNQAFQPPILFGRPELLGMVLTYDGINTKFNLDRKNKTEISPVEVEEVLAWTKQQLAQLADALSRRLDQAVSINESPEQAETSRRPNVVFLGSGFSKYLASGVDQLPPGWSCNWQELVESVESELNEEQLKLYNEIADNHQNNFEYKLWYLQEILGEKFGSVFSTLFKPGTSSLGKLRAAKGRQWKLVKELLQRSDGVVTTNYDPIALEVLREIEAVGYKLHVFHEDASMKIKVEAKSLIHSISTTSAVRSKEKFIVFLHGHADFESNDDCSQVWNNVVMTFKQYAEAYLGYEPTRSSGLSIADYLRTLLSDCSVTLLGYSLSDFVIASVFILGAKTRSEDQPHYLIFNTKEGGLQNGEPASTKRHALRTSYPSMAYLKKIDDLYGLKLIPLEAVAETHRFAGIADASAVIPTIGDGMDLVLSRLSLGASKQEASTARSHFDKLISEEEDSE